MDVQGWVVIAVALLLFGYLVPHLVTTRQQMAESRVDDRFSTALRVVATGTTVRETAPADHHGVSRPYLHDPRRRTEGPAVKRPTTAGERAASEARRLAAARAARAAEISRRQAAARRRLVLTVTLLLGSIGGWVAFGAASMSIALGIVPTVLLGAVLVAGRRAAKIAARRNAADRAAMARLELRPAPRTTPATTAQARSAVGEGSEGAEGTSSAAADETREEAGAAAASGHADEDGTAEQPAVTRAERSTGDWTPVPVPAPTYTLKARAPRRDVAPYTAPEAPAAGAEDAPVATPAAPTVAPAAPAVAPAAAAPAGPAAAAPTTTAAAASATAEESGLAGSPYAPVALTDAEAEAEVAPLPEPAAGGIDLDSVLARRRAVGA